ncbi:MAG: hypothetical protein ONB48_12765 [candidate division KSB1 bacterium]|nr:hypothetical protein [candidate division KSB1 bacterium]MDZ7275033.1 hypothetical protein [candidate division KSB1 bacterium]MDZ7286518.1 hypothetical protein [candidate division KSB1 bacterium]MDZ7299318.1 hypothetical protein [candidate division KSB1 bacterium]MDZ7306989.1 hypothetical protein [candidate division KSB1 bacterium]
MILPLSVLAQKPWQLAYRLQAGFEHDSNIYEASATANAATVGRALLHGRAERVSENFRLALDHSGALLLYHDHHDEHKLLNDFKAGMSVRTADWLRFNARGEIMLKNYLHAASDYATAAGTLSAALTLSDRLAWEAGAETGQLDHAASDSLFDYTFTGAFLTLRQRLTQRTTIELSAHTRTFAYLRPAYLHVGTAGVQRSRRLQNDDYKALRLTFTISRKWLLRASLEAQFNPSNSLGYDYDRLRLHLLAAWSPAGRWLLRASALVQRKSYGDPMPPIVPPEFDAEREQSNNLIFDLSRDLSAELALLVRLAHHDNESPVRGVFYRKTVLFAGFELRF